MLNLTSFVPRKKGLILRALSLVLVCAFFAQELSFAEGLEALKLQPTPTQLISQNPSLFEAPSQFVSMKEIHKGNKDSLILLIEDAHSNYSGQRNMASALDAIMAKYNVSLVLTEGGVEDCSLDELKAVAPANVWKRVGKSLLMEGKIAGEEYLNLTSDHPMKIMGLEDIELYLKSVQTYSALTDKREKNLRYLTSIQEAVSKLKNKLYPADLLSYEKAALNGHRASDKNFEAAFKVLAELAQKHQVDLSEFPELSDLMQLQQREKQIDFDKANLEQAALIEEMALDIRVLGSQLGAAGQKIPQFTFFQNTLNIAKNKHIDLEKYPSYLAYGDYLKDFADIDLDRVLDQYEKAEDKIYVSVIASEAKQSEIASSPTAPRNDILLIRAIDRYLGLLDSAYHIQMTIKDFEMFIENEPDFGTLEYQAFINRKLAEFGYFDSLIPYEHSFEQDKALLKEFYGSVDKRDMAFLDNAQKYLRREKLHVAAMITGGYHTPHLKKLLMEQGYSVAVLTPFVTSETNQAKYERELLAPIKKPLKKVMVGSDESYSQKRSKSILDADIQKLVNKKKNGVRAFATLPDFIGARLGEMDDSNRSSQFIELRLAILEKLRYIEAKLNGQEGVNRTTLDELMAKWSRVSDRTWRPKQVEASNAELQVVPAGARMADRGWVDIWTKRLRDFALDILSIFPGLYQPVDIDMLKERLQSREFVALVLFNHVINARKQKAILDSLDPTTKRCVKLSSLILNEYIDWSKMGFGANIKKRMDPVKFQHKQMLDAFSQKSIYGYSIYHGPFEAAGGMAYLLDVALESPDAVGKSLLKERTPILIPERARFAYEIVTYEDYKNDTGIYIVVADKDAAEPAVAGNYLYFIVPESLDRVFAVATLSKMVNQGLIDTADMNNIAMKIITYEEAQAPDLIQNMQRGARLATIDENAIQSYLGMIRDENDSVRREGYALLARAVNDYGADLPLSSQIYGSFYDGLSDRDAVIRTASAMGIGFFNVENGFEAEALPILENLILSRHEDLDVRRAAAYSLSRAEGAMVGRVIDVFTRFVAAETLVYAAAQFSTPVGIFVQELLSKYALRNAILSTDQIARLAEDQNPAVRFFSLWAIGEAGSKFRDNDIVLQAVLSRIRFSDQYPGDSNQFVRDQAGVTFNHIFNLSSHPRVGARLAGEKGDTESSLRVNTNLTNLGSAVLLAGFLSYMLAFLRFDPAFLYVGTGAVFIGSALAILASLKGGHDILRTASMAGHADNEHHRQLKEIERLKTIGTPEAVQELERLFENEADWIIRIKILEAVSNNINASPFLGRIADEAYPDAFLRARAQLVMADAVYRINNAGPDAHQRNHDESWAKAMLPLYMAGSSVDERLHAVVQLDRIGTPQAVNLLKEHFPREVDSSVQIRILEALIRHPEASDLITMASDEARLDPRVRDAAKYLLTIKLEKLATNASQGNGARLADGNRSPERLSPVTSGQDSGVRAEGSRLKVSPTLRRGEKVNISDNHFLSKRWILWNDRGIEKLAYVLYVDAPGRTQDAQLFIPDQGVVWRTKLQIFNNAYRVDNPKDIPPDLIAAAEHEGARLATWEPSPTQEDIPLLSGVLGLGDAASSSSRTKILVNKLTAVEKLGLIGTPEAIQVLEKTFDRESELTVKATILKALSGHIEAYPFLGRVAGDDNMDLFLRQRAQLLVDDVFYHMTTAEQGARLSVSEKREISFLRGDIRHFLGQANQKVVEGLAQDKRDELWGFYSSRALTGWAVMSRIETLIREVRALILHDMFGEDLKDASKILSRNVSELPLSERVQASLDKASIHTIEDLVDRMNIERGPTGLINTKGFGPSAVREIRLILEMLGLSGSRLSAVQAELAAENMIRAAGRAADAKVENDKDTEKVAAGVALDVAHTRIREILKEALSGDAERNSALAITNILLQHVANGHYELNRTGALTRLKLHLEKILRDAQLTDKVGPEFPEHFLQVARQTHQIRNILLSLYRGEIESSAAVIALRDAGQANVTIERAQSIVKNFVLTLSGIRLPVASGQAPADSRRGSRLADGDKSHDTESQSHTLRLGAIGQASADRRQGSRLARVATELPILNELDVYRLLENRFPSEELAKYFGSKFPFYRVRHDVSGDGIRVIVAHDENFKAGNSFLLNHAWVMIFNEKEYVGGAEVRFDARRMWEPNAHLIIRNLGYMERAIKLLIKSGVIDGWSEDALMSNATKMYDRINKDPEFFVEDDTVKLSEIGIIKYRVSAVARPEDLGVATAPLGARLRGMNVPLIEARSQVSEGRSLGQFARDFGRPEDAQLPSLDKLTDLDLVILSAAVGANSFKSGQYYAVDFADGEALVSVSSNTVTLYDKNIETGSRGNVIDRLTLTDDQMEVGRRFRERLRGVHIEDALAQRAMPDPVVALAQHSNQLLNMTQKGETVVVNVVAADIFGELDSDKVSVESMIKANLAFLKAHRIYIRFIDTQYNNVEEYEHLSSANELKSGTYPETLLASSSSLSNMAVRAESGLFVIEEKASQIIPIVPTFATAADVRRSKEPADDKNIQRVHALTGVKPATEDMMMLRSIPAEFNNNKGAFLAEYERFTVKLLDLTLGYISRYSALVRAISSAA